MKNWKRRYFILEENSMSYFKSDLVSLFHPAPALHKAPFSPPDTQQVCSMVPARPGGRATTHTCESFRSNFSSPGPEHGSNIHAEFNILSSYLYISSACLNVQKTLPLKFHLFIECASSYVLLLHDLQAGKSLHVVQFLLGGVALRAPEDSTAASFSK